MSEYEICTSCAGTRVAKERGGDHPNEYYYDITCTSCAGTGRDSIRETDDGIKQIASAYRLHSLTWAGLIQKISKGEL